MTGFIHEIEFIGCKIKIFQFGGYYKKITP